jgi:acyl-CoA synthetase (AMP-forming)/AMP-acid ligase II
VTDLYRKLLAGPDNAPALISDHEMVTFAALRRRVEAMATALFGPVDKRLAFSFLPNSLDLVTIYLSAVTGGHAIGLLPPATPTHRKRQLVEAYRPEVVLVADDELAEFLGNAGYRAGEASKTRCWISDGGGDISAELAVLLSTSGSTGTPKLVRLSTENIAANAAGVIGSLGISPDQRAVTSIPLCYSYGLSVLNSHLAAASAVVVTGLTPVTSHFWNLVHEHEVTTVGGTPMAHRTILGRRRAALPPSLRVMTQAGGRLSAELTESALAWMAETGGHFFCMYGQTEATSRISCLDASRLAEKPGSVGTALSGGHISVGPSGGDDVGGPISYTGPNVMMGYAGSRDDLSRGREVQVLETGDLGRLDADGFLYVTGRSSRFAKVLDRRVSLDDVEEWFQLADRCVAVAGADGRAPAIVVFTTCPLDALEPARRALTAALAAPSSTVAICPIDDIPRTINGKVDYARLQCAAAGIHEPT